MIQTCAESMRLQLERRNTAVAARWWWRQRNRDSSHVCDSALQGGRCVQTVDNRRDTCNVSRPCGYGGDATAHPTEQTSSHSPTTYMWMASHLDNKTNTASSLTRKCNGCRDYAFREHTGNPALSSQGRIWDCRSVRGWSRMFLSWRPRLHHIT